MSIPDISTAECLYAASEVEAAIEAMGERITRQLAGQDCLVLCVLQGAIVTVGKLLPHIGAPVELDSVHVTRYRNTTSGGDIEWRMRPQTPVSGRHVLLVDDILDEGHSLAAVSAWLREEGAARVLSAVLVDKQHGRRQGGFHADFVGLSVPDRYVFGYGMDYQGWYRNVPGIFAVAE